jgi:hypothetical protein
MVGKAFQEEQKNEATAVDALSCVSNGGGAVALFDATVAGGTRRRLAAPRASLRAGSLRQPV